MDKKKRIQDIWIKDVRADETLSKAAKHFALALYQYADNDTGKCYPSQPRMYKDWGISERAFYTGKDELVASSYITYTKRYNKSNEYQLVIARKRGLPIACKRGLLQPANEGSNYSPSSYITTLKGDIGIEEGISAEVSVEDPDYNPGF